MKSICEYCGYPNDKPHNKYWYMCHGCGVLYKRYTDLRSVVKNGAIVQANKADKKLMDIVDIYKARAARGLKVPDSIKEYCSDLRKKKLLDVCEWCGRTKVFTSDTRVDMCEDCCKMYNKFMRMRSGLKDCVEYYRQKEKMGYRVPVVMKDYN